MRRQTMLAAVAIAIAAVPAVPAAAKDVNECAPATRWCHGVFDKHGRLFLDLAGFGLKGSYRLCVTPPKARERCKSFGLRRNATGAYDSSVRFTSNFPHRRHGRYRARWLYDGRQLGRILSFSA
ncbi:MAG: hypothetical protein JWQ20_4050 [Conexibacter sp.]|jgi:hypothetical protein|nr:hypothetical protein [Conexibacter sp.]